jgi:DNA-binding response OmpR family regulator
MKRQNMAYKILTVDDDHNILKLLEISLTKAGYDVITVDNAEEAIAIASEQKPDLIISDISMPEMDGIEFCWMIREKSDVPLTPFIFLSSLRDPDFEIRGFRAGADDFLSKPIDRADLLSHVETLITRNKKLTDIDSSPKNTDQSKGFSGDVSELSLVEIFQLISINKRSGTLKLNDSMVYFKDGNIIKATHEGWGNEEAVYELVKLKTGTFQFINMPISFDAEITTNTMHLIVEACRLMDENE